MNFHPTLPLFIIRRHQLLRVVVTPQTCAIPVLPAAPPRPVHIAAAGEGEAAPAGIQRHHRLLQGDGDVGGQGGRAQGTAAAIRTDEAGWKKRSLHVTHRKREMIDPVSSVSLPFGPAHPFPKCTQPSQVQLSFATQYLDLNVSPRGTGIGFPMLLGLQQVRWPWEEQVTMMMRESSFSFSTSFPEEDIFPQIDFFAAV